MLEGTVKFFLKKTGRKRGVAETPQGKVFLPATAFRIQNPDGTLCEEFNGHRVFPVQGEMVVITKHSLDGLGHIAHEWYVKRE